MRLADLFGVFRAWDRYRAEMLEYAERFDVLVTPVFAWPAPPHGGTETLGTGEGLSYLTPFSLTGWPCAVVRCGWSPERLPIGVQCVARPWRDDVALVAAACLEDALGGWEAPLLDSGA